MAATRGAFSADAEPYSKQTRSYNPEVTHFLRIKKISLPNVKVDIKNCDVTVSGPQSRVEIALRSLDDIVNNLKIESVTVSEDFSLCFKSVQRNDIIPEFNRKGIFAAYGLNQDKLYACSDNTRSVREAIDFLQSVIVEKEYPESRPLKPAEVQAVSTQGWDTFKQKLLDENSAHNLQIQFDSETQKLKFVLRSSTNSVRQIISQLDQYFATNAVTKSSLVIPEDLLALVLKNEDFVLKYCGNEDVAIDFSKLQISGECTVTSPSEELLSDTLAKLKDLKRVKCVEFHSSHRRGFVHWLQSSAGKDRLGEINVLSNTISAEKIGSKPVVPKKLLNSSHGDSTVSPSTIPEDVLSMVDIVSGDIAVVQVS